MVNIHQNKYAKTRRVWFFLGETTMTWMKLAAVGERLWPPALLVLSLGLVGYSLLPPVYEIKANEARQACEKQVESGQRAQAECDKNYNNAMERGRAAHRAKINGQAAPP